MNHCVLRPSLRPAWSLLCVCFFPVTLPISAQESVATLPKAEQILEKHLSAVGGREQLEKQRTSVAKGKLKMPELGLEADILVRAKFPNKFALEFELPGAGEFRKATDGEIAWEINPMMGARLLEGEEKQQFMKEADMHGQLHPEKYYKLMETLDEVELDGRPHYKVKLVTTDDNPEIRYYDAETFYLTKIEQVAITPMGDLDIVVNVGDYRKVDGLLLPFEMSQNIMGQRQVFAFDSIEINGEVPDEHFAVPEEIAELRDPAKPN